MAYSLSSPVQSLSTYVVTQRLLCLILQYDRRLTETYQVVDDNVRRTATQVNTKFDMTGKARQAANQ